jgi:T-complex protein 1 subunit beta
MSSFIGAIAIADLVKTTLGPKGMDKILQSVGSPDGAVTVGREGGREGREGGANEMAWIE